ncbi:hypothetical protein Sbs19_43320 [Sphingobium sp. BS19]|nr:hypothetical protein Sbs19_43320 [Sphingobium sp. BS19]
MSAVVVSGIPAIKSALATPVGSIDRLGNPAAQNRDGADAKTSSHPSLVW